MRSVESWYNAFVEMYSITTLDFTEYKNKLPKLKNYYRTLRNCTSLTSSMPEEVFWSNPSEPDEHTDTFSNDTNIANYASIPSDWGGGGA